METYKAVDLLKVMEELTKKWVKYYQTDLNYDLSDVSGYAVSDTEEEKTLVWMLRRSGTWLFREYKVFEARSFDNMTWKYYAARPEEIKTYRIQIVGSSEGRIFGNITEIDYLKHVKEVEMKEKEMHENQ